MNQTLKTLGILGLLIVVIGFTIVYEWSKYGHVNFTTYNNIGNTLRWTGLFGILSIGVAFVIITGGIDLSVGSLIAFSAVLAALLIRDVAGAEQASGVGMVLCSLGAIAAAGVVGLGSGLLVTGFAIPPFVVTLGMMLAMVLLARVWSELKKQKTGFAVVQLTMVSVVAVLMLTGR